MREMGVGDLTVPKRVKRAAAGFYERSGVYREALANPGDRGQGDALAVILAQTILQAESANDFAHALARYVRKSADQLSATSTSDMDLGKVDFAQFQFAPDVIASEA
jgi:cytochrome b pre-mRNA-processing protein 3